MAVIERVLAQVPPTTYAQLGIAATTKWSSEYNTACWLRRTGLDSARVTLTFRYVDASGARRIVVDSADYRQDGGLLLAGRVTLPATGPISEMTVWLAGDPHCDIVVDELYVQRMGAKAALPVLSIR